MVVGTGPAGLAAVLALAAVGVRVQAVGPPPPDSTKDTRTAALFGGSISFLRNLGAWDDCPGAAPLNAIRLIDDTGGLLKAPEVLFEAADIGQETLGFNVPNAGLTEKLWQAVSEHPRVEVRPTRAVVHVAIEDRGVRLRTAEGDELTAPLAVAADGRNSICRSAAAIATRSWSDDQSAIAATFGHDRPHRSISTEFHRPNGPLTTVPMPGLASSLVWVERASVAAQLMALDDTQFARALGERLQGLLGKIDSVGPRRMFPLSGMVADRFSAGRIALVGEAAHVMPPIGAQGLNLSFRDAAAIAECVAGAAADLGGEAAAALLSRYDAMRRADVVSRSTAVDALNRSLVSGYLPMNLARGLGLHLVRGIPLLKRELIRQGLQSVGPRLALMQHGGAGLLAA